MMSFWVVPWSECRADAVLLGDRHVEREQPGRRGVDRHRRVHLVERDAVEQRVHVPLVGDRTRRPCRPRRAPARGQGRSPSGWAGRTRPTGRSGPSPGCAGRARSTRARSNALRRCASPTGCRARAAVLAHDPMIVWSAVREQRDRRHAPGSRPGDLRLRDRRPHRRPGTGLMRRDAARPPRPCRAARPALDPHPPRSRGRHGRALPALPGAAPSTCTSAARRT